MKLVFALLGNRNTSDAFVQFYILPQITLLHVFNVIDPFLKDYSKKKSNVGIKAPAPQTPFVGFQFVPFNEGAR